MCGLMHQLDTFQLPQITLMNGSNGGRMNLMSNSFSLWVKITLHSTLLFSHLPWSVLVSHGLNSILLVLLSSWTMKLMSKQANQRSFLNQETLVFSEMMLWAPVFHLKYGATIYLLTDLKTKTLFSFGLTSLQRTTMNYLLTLEISATVSLSFWLVHLKKLCQHMLIKKTSIKQIVHSLMVSLNDLTSTLSWWNKSNLRMHFVPLWNWVQTVTYTSKKISHGQLTRLIHSVVLKLWMLPWML